MSSVTTFPQFMFLPLEIRQNIWQDAASTGPMRLDLSKYEARLDQDYVMLFLSTECRNHVAKHQRQRFAVYMASEEARHECLRHSTLVLTDSIQLYLGEYSCICVEEGYVDPRKCFRTLLIDWRSDLVVMEFLNPDLFDARRDSFCPQFPWASITRLGLRNDVFMASRTFPGRRLEVQRRKSKYWLECWSSVQEITFVLDDCVERRGYLAPSSAPQLDWRAPLEVTYRTSNAFEKELKSMKRNVLDALYTAGIFREEMDKLGRKAKVETVLELSWP
ncbi:hypothetical protein PFICI_07407 [Pestalotiopsis fici W106-1]|uniref:2EXR domain-containing protein n=1 Tax=Pestalotiopsis fici (strain W106-1 / CGMCC3.15140) TaxID=1229662 RepID=W3X174_PESFW|nr:uncharacterized protein PFICI_07407 [Pestalotiopsis fici W106-1]ETS79878.1 hypothetical protein PFICI_07407 [Pestalotiopsis fici W106-1]